MKKLLIGAAVGALLLPAAPALAQHFEDDGHDHACVDEACTVFELFQTPAEGATVLGYQGIETPKYGTWGFNLAGRETDHEEATVPTEAAHEIAHVATDVVADDVDAATA